VKSSITETIIQNLSFLELIGFKVSVKTRENQFDKNKKYEVINYKLKNIYIEIIFREFVDCKDIDLTISRTDNKNSFSLDEYFLAKGKSKEYFQGRTDEQNDLYIERFCSAFKEEVLSELKEVLNGNKWIEVPKDYSRIR
jgi:hypothetical protein